MKIPIILPAMLLSAAAAATVTLAESPAQWFREGRAAVAAAKRIVPIGNKAKNVILFIGDGMGVTTVTAARIYEGQRRGRTGEENRLSFETLPYTALIKTYNTNQQTPDSAGTMTAIVTGVKTKSGVLSVNQNVVPGDYRSVENTRLTTVVELAERGGRSTGIVTTARVTHATPAACYAHVPQRAWEADSSLPQVARDAGFPDIARQLIEFAAGDGMEVVLGGGRRAFLPASMNDPEYRAQPGRRLDGRDLTAEWLERPGAAYVWNKRQFDAVDPTKTSRLLGLFEYSHMRFEQDRRADTAGEPSLSEMTAKAIDLLSRNDKGFFLMVEGARIDHAHHFATAHRALTDTVEFANAVRVAMQKTDRLDTLIIVTADHSQLLTMTGYAVRGNPILGKVVVNDALGNATATPAKDISGLPYTTLGYTTGPPHGPAFVPRGDTAVHSPLRGSGHPTDPAGRPDLTTIDTEDPNYFQEVLTISRDWPHSGEDVALYADGPNAHLFRGVLEQNVIFHVMIDALDLGE